MPAAPGPAALGPQPCPTTTLAGLLSPHRPRPAAHHRPCSAAPRATWGATFLCWLKQEMGLGRVLLNRLGLETVVRINSPVQARNRREKG